MNNYLNRPPKDDAELEELGLLPLHPGDDCMMDDDVPGDLTQPGTQTPRDDVPPTSEEEPHLTDLGNATQLVNRHGQDLRFCADWNKWGVWDATRWSFTPLAEAYAEERAKETVLALGKQAKEEACKLEQKTQAMGAVSSEDPRFNEYQKLLSLKEWYEQRYKHFLKSEGSARIDAIMKRARTIPTILISHHQLDSHPLLLNCPNGTVDLSTGRLHSHRRSHLITQMTNVSFNLNARCPRFEAFIQAIFPDIPDPKKPERKTSAELIPFVQRALGYSLTGLVSEQCLFFCYGYGANGKSTLLETCLGILGNYGIQTPPNLLLERHHDPHPTENATLFARRFATAIEPKSKYPLDESKVKYLTGGDTITARRMNEDFWEFPPTHKFWLAANKKPHIRGTDFGIWRRIYLIPFVHQFTGEKIKDFWKILVKEEGEGILAWMVRGCQMWLKDGLMVPDCVREATDEYKQEEDRLARFFDECCTVGANERELFSRLYREYSEWTQDRNETPLSATAFALELKRRGFQDERGEKGTKFRLGLRLNSTLRS